MEGNAQLRAAVRQVEEQILAATGNRFERIAFLSRDGAPLFTKDGDVGEVVLSEAEAGLLTTGAELITHNHPHGMSLSTDDVLSAIELGAREIDAFSAQVRFRLMRRAGGAWPSRAAAEAGILAPVPTHLRADRE